MLSGEKEIKNLNRKFRNKNKATDVLSFPFYTKKELHKRLTHQKEIYLGDIIINLNKKVKNYYKHPAGKYYLNDKTFSMLYPLLNNQNYLNKVEKYNNQNIDINFDILRSLPINLLFDNSTYASIISTSFREK